MFVTVLPIWKNRYVPIGISKWHCFLCNYNQTFLIGRVTIDRTSDRSIYLKAGPRQNFHSGLKKGAHYRYTHTEVSAINRPLQRGFDIRLWLKSSLFPKKVSLLRGVRYIKVLLISIFQKSDTASYNYHVKSPALATNFAYKKGV